MIKIAGDIIILHMCNINDNHMMYSSWDTERDGQNFFVILDRFLLSPILPPSNLGNQIFEKMKKPINDNHMMYGSWDIERDTQNLLSFWTVFYPFTSPPNNLENQNFEKL